MFIQRTWNLTPYTEEGKVPLEGYTYIYSGGDKHEHGVGFMIKSSIEKSLLGYWPVSSRNIMLKLRAKPFDIAIIQTYAPTSSYSEEEIEEHYEEVEMMIKEVKSTDVLIITGDFNAKMGKGSYQDLVGNHGLVKRNQRGDRMLQFCIENDLIVTNTTFQHPNRLLYTWKSPGDISRHQLDYLLIRKRHRNSVKQCRTYPGADISSDHNPVIAKISVRLKRAMPKNQNKKKEFIDWGKLKVPEMKEKYMVDVSNRYETLSLEADEQGEVSQGNKIKAKWENLKSSILHANESAPKVEKKGKQRWMTDDILEKMEIRKRAKNTPDYKIYHKEIQKACKLEKEKWVNEKCEEIEENLRVNGTKKMHANIKELVGDKKGNAGSSCIKDKGGKMLFEKDQVLQRWSEYIGDLFADDRPPLPTPSNNDGPPIMKEEVEKALKSTQMGKAPR